MQMGRRAKARTASTADAMVTLLGVAGFLGFLLAARMDGANASAYGVLAFAWFFIFGGIKFRLPLLVSKRAATNRAPAARRSSRSSDMTDTSVGP